MPKIAVIGGRDSILGFTAMGIEVFPVEDETQALKETTRLAREEDQYAIIFMTDDLAEKIDKQLEDLKKSIPLLPVIVIIPSHKGSLGLATLKMRKMVEKALGADILFSR